jgi:hypothetical protein
MEGEAFTTCPGCGRRIDPDDPANLKAVEMMATGTFGDPADNNDLSEGMGAVFHPSCFNPRDPNWKLADS